MSNLFRSILAILLAVSTVAASTTVSATENPLLVTSPTGFNEVKTPYGQERVSDARSLVSDSNSLNLHVPQSDIDWDKSAVTSIDGQSLVSVPLKNSESEWSNISFHFDEDAQLVGYAEAHFTPLSNTSGKAEVYQDGKIVINDIFEAEDNGMTFYGIKDAIGELNSCLSAAGIPAWIVAAASVACSAAGGWAGIIACYTAAGIFGGTVGYCAGKAAQQL